MLFALITGICKINYIDKTKKKKKKKKKKKPEIGTEPIPRDSDRRFHLVQYQWVKKEQFGLRPESSSSADRFLVHVK